MAGTITGLKSEKLQKTQYPYPVLDSRELHLWPRHRRVYYYPAWGWGPYYPGWVWGTYPAWSWGWGWGWGWYYPDWDYYPGDID